MVSLKRLFSAVGILLAVGAPLPGAGATDEGLHYASILEGCDILRSGFRPSAARSIWLQSSGNRGSAAMADGKDGKERGWSSSAGCTLATPRLLGIPLSVSAEVFGFRRWGEMERAEADDLSQKWDGTGGGGELFLRVLGNDLRLIAAGERVKSSEREDDGLALRSDVLHLGACLAHRLIPIGPLALGLELSALSTRIATKDSAIALKSGDGESLFGKKFGSVANWRAAPGIFLAFSGLGHVGCRAGGRWVWDFGSRRPTFSSLVPHFPIDGDIADAWNAVREKGKTGPKSGYGEMELALSVGLGHRLSAELDAIAYCGKRRGARIFLTAARDF
ncbi:MAG: hypothetical protein LBB14_03395 [Puniceicoccales bacterium]|nr:hypothetical protein [Puniceicoccales bacterium]